MAYTGTGTSTNIETANAAGTLPSFKPAAASGITTIDGDTGSITGSTVSILAGVSTQNCGSSVSISGSGTTLTLNVTNNQNTIIGNLAGNATLSGAGVTCLGYNAGHSLTTSNNSTYIGYNSGAANTTLGANSCFGASSGQNFTTGTRNTLIGYLSGSNYSSSESNNIILGNSVQGTAAESNVLRIGLSTGSGNNQINKAFIAGIQTITVTGTAVLVSSSDQLGIAVSSIRYKDDVKDMGDDSSPLYKMRPVSFKYKNSSHEKCYGLIAEEVNEVMPELIVYDKEGLPMTVKYHDIPAILLNELIKLQKRVAYLESK